MNPQRHPQTQDYSDAKPSDLDRKSKGGVWKYLLIGCVGVILAAVLVAVVGTVLLAKTIGGVLEQDFHDTNEQYIGQSYLPPDQKVRVITRLEGLDEEFKARKITREQRKVIQGHVMNSPLLNISLVVFIDQQHVQTSGLSDEEKALGHRTMSRLARGLGEGVIDRLEIEALTSSIRVTPMPRQMALRPAYTNDELRDFLIAAKALADSDSIPDEAYETDLAVEVDKALNDAITYTFSVY